MENNVIGEVGFVFSSRFSQLIGRQLISNPIVAVSELVKNAYDADADNVSVEFHQLLSEKPCLSIIDDGDGMTFNDVKTKWMMVGTDNKVHTPFTPLEEVMILQFLFPLIGTSMKGLMGNLQN